MSVHRPSIVNTDSSCDNSEVDSDKDVDFGDVDASPTSSVSSVLAPQYSPISDVDCGDRSIEEGGRESDEDDAVPLNDGDDSSIVAAGTHNLGENVTYEQTGNGGKRLS